MERIIETFTIGDTQFELGKDTATGRVTWFVACWKNPPEYDVNHWFVYKNTEDEARKEFERWRS
jgi:hypothetical protein